MAKATYIRMAGIKVVQNTEVCNRENRFVSYATPFKIGQTSFVMAVCKCGNEVLVSVPHLRTGHTSSCGCYLNDRRAEAKRTHGCSGTKVFNAWLGMKGRCGNPANKRFALYGGRGIEVCERWKKSFDAFLQDMGQPQTQCHSIDRIDTNGNYEPGNCRWATMREQCNNRRNCVNVTLYGQTKSITEWSRISFVPSEAIRRRLIRGWDEKRAVFFMDQQMTARETAKAFPNGG